MINNHSQWTEDTVEHSLSAANTELDGSGVEYLRGDFRFLEEDSKQDVLDSFSTQLDSALDWYRIAYHQCTHDGTGGACSWDDVIEKNSSQIPSGVPTYSVQ